MTEVKKFFETEIPEDCKKAISKLKRMKVFKLAALDDGIETFADVWWAVLHEVDLYEEGEHTDVKEGAMTRKQAEDADAWLIDTVELFNKYRDVSTFPDEFAYGGQLIEDPADEPEHSDLDETVAVEEDDELPAEVEDLEDDADDEEEEEVEEEETKKLNCYRVKFDNGESIEEKIFEVENWNAAKEMIAKTEEELGWKKVGKLKKV